MDEALLPETKAPCHVVAVPYPGRGHVNPMMNLCKLLASKKPDILITFVVTEEWLGFMGSSTKSSNIKFASIPNILPSELVRGADFPGFYESVMTKMGDPFDELLDQLESPVNTILADMELLWVIPIGNRRNIPVATLCTFPANIFSVFQSCVHIQNPQMLVDLLDRDDELGDCIQGISSKDITELRAIFPRHERQVMHLTLRCVSLVPEGKYILFNSVYELEQQAFITLKEKLDLPVYPIGPAIPYFELEGNYVRSSSSNKYFRWLESQPTGSVLYVSLGSFLSVSNEQMDEIAAGLRDSGVRFLWVARGESSRWEEGCGDKGVIVPWCDQLNVLCHRSVGGFWTHCGWNSTLEAIYAGVSLLTFPLLFDQVPNSKQIVENWRIGWEMKKNADSTTLVTRDKISELVQRFMDVETNEGTEMRARAKELQEICRKAFRKGGSSDKNLDDFIEGIS